MNQVKRNRDIEYRASAPPGVCGPGGGPQGAGRGGGVRGTRGRDEGKGAPGRRMRQRGVETGSRARGWAVGAGSWGLEGVAGGVARGRGRGPEPAAGQWGRGWEEVESVGGKGAGTSAAAGGALRTRDWPGAGPPPPAPGQSPARTVGRRVPQAPQPQACGSG